MLRTSTTPLTPCALSSWMNSLSGRVEWPMVKTVAYIFLRSAVTVSIDPLDNEHDATTNTLMRYVNSERLQNRFGWRVFAGIMVPLVEAR